MGQGLPVVHKKPHEVHEAPGEYMGPADVHKGLPGVKKRAPGEHMGPPDAGLPGVHTQPAQMRKMARVQQALGHKAQREVHWELHQEVHEQMTLLQQQRVDEEQKVLLVQMTCVAKPTAHFSGPMGQQVS